MTLLLLDFNYVYLFVLRSLKQKRCGGRSFVEACISNMMEWNFCSNSIFEINLMLLWYEILEKLVTYFFVSALLWVCSLCWDRWNGR